jgi:hypothetical protein
MVTMIMISPSGLSIPYVNLLTHVIFNITNLSLITARRVCLSVRLPHAMLSGYKSFVPELKYWVWHVNVVTIRLKANYGMLDNYQANAQNVANMNELQKMWRVIVYSVFISKGLH